MGWQFIKWDEYFFFFQKIMPLITKSTSNSFCTKKKRVHNIENKIAPNKYQTFPQNFRYLQSLPQQNITLPPLFFTWDTAKWLVRRRHAPNNNKLFTKPLNKSQNLAEIVLFFGYRHV